MDESISQDGNSFSLTRVHEIILFLLLAVNSGESHSCEVMSVN